MFYLNSTLNFGIPLVLVFQLEVCYRVDRLLTGITALQKGTTARWYSNKTSLSGLSVKFDPAFFRKCLTIFYNREVFALLITGMLRLKPHTMNLIDRKKKALIGTQFFHYR